MSGNPKIRPALLWQSKSLGRSGYATMAREFLRELSQRPLDLAFRPFDAEPEEDPETRQAGWYGKISSAPIREGSSYVACYAPAGRFGGSYFHEAKDRNPDHLRYIGYTMFETDRIPSHWTEAIEAMDEIWVPTQFNADTFSRSGVPREKLRVMPLGVDPARFAPENSRPYPLCTHKPFRFLSVFEWSLRKGWDALLRAYVREFRKEDPVCLVLCSYRGDGVRQNTEPVSIRHEIDRFLENECGIARSEAPEILLLEERIPEDRWADLYASANAFVLPTRGEGWGLPFTEAAVAGLPVIATAWSGQLEFLNRENAYLIEVDGLHEVLPGQVRDNWLFAGHRWAEPSLVSLRAHLRHVFECRSEAQAKGKLARETILAQFTSKHAADRVVSRLEEIEDKKDASSIPALPSRQASEREPLRLLWVGDDVEEDGLRTLLACCCAAFDEPGIVDLTVASATERSAKKIEATVAHFRPLCRSSLRFALATSESDRAALLGRADCFVYPSTRMQESALVREAVSNGIAVLASEEAVPRSVREAKQGLFLYAKKLSKGRGESRRLVGKVYPAALAQSMQWAGSHREDLRRMGLAAREILSRPFSRIPNRIPVLCSQSISLPSERFEWKRIDPVPERGGWSGFVNAELFRTREPLAVLVEGDIAPSEEAFQEIVSDSRAAMLCEVSSRGSCVIVRPQKALAYASLDERFSGFDALREWVRAVRAAGGAVLGQPGQRLGAPFDSDKDDGAIALLELADALVAERKISEAVAAARQALAWKPDYLAAMVFLGHALSERVEKSERTEAGQWVEKALDLCPANARARHILARILVGEKKFEEALVQLQLVSQLDSESAEVWNDLGVVQGCLGMLHESLGSLAQSQRIDANNADAWHNGAQVLEAVGDVEQARQWRERAHACVGAS